MSLWYFVIGEAIVLLMLFDRPKQRVDSLHFGAAVVACVCSVILWPLILSAWLRDRFRS